MAPSVTRTAVEINGFALREIRIRSGIEVADLARQWGVGRAYVARIELGHSVRVSAKAYAALLDTLQIKDRRALLAQPHERAA